MTISLLRYMLTHQPTSLKVALDAILSGELQVDVSNPKDENLLTDALFAQKENQGMGHEGNRIALELFQKLDEMGFSPWLKSAGKDGFDGALVSQNPLLILWLSQHPDAPQNLHERTVSPSFGATTYSPLSSYTTPKVLDALLQVGFDPHIKDADGDNLLHKAKSAEEVALLLDAGVDPSEKNKYQQDVRAKWDKGDIPKSDLKKMEAELNKYAPIDKERLVRSFGQQIVEVGVARTKERFKEAKVAPYEAKYAGFGLPELAAAEALSTALKIGTKSEGNYISHKKWRRILLAVLKMNSDLDENGEVSVSRQEHLRPTFEIVRNLDIALLMPRVKGAMLSNTDSDDTRMLLNKALGMNSSSWDAAASYSVFEKMVNAGLIENPSRIATAIFLRENKTPDILNSKNEQGIPGHVLWGRAALSWLWDEKWGKAHYGIDDAMRSQISYSPEVLSSLIDSTELAYPMLLGFLATGGSVMTSKYAEALYDQLDKKPLITMSDPCLVAALNRISSLPGRGAFPIIDKLEKRVRIYAEENDLERNTQTALSKRQGIRL